MLPSVLNTHLLCWLPWLHWKQTNVNDILPSIKVVQSYYLMSLSIVRWCERNCDSNSSKSTPTTICCLKSKQIQVLQVKRPSRLKYNVNYVKGNYFASMF